MPSVTYRPIDNLYFNIDRLNIGIIFMIRMIYGILRLELTLRPLH